MWVANLGDKTVQIEKRFIWNGSKLAHYVVDNIDSKISEVFTKMNVQDVENYFDYLSNRDFQHHLGT